MSFAALQEPIPQAIQREVRSSDKKRPRPEVFVGEPIVLNTEFSFGTQPNDGRHGRPV